MAGSLVGCGDSGGDGGGVTDPGGDDDGGGGGGGGADPDVVVDATADLTFNPDQVTIEPGQTVRWRYAGGPPHTVTPDGHDEWNSASLSSDGDTFDHTFEDAGEYPYYCEPHRSQGMVGTIVVEQSM